MPNSEQRNFVCPECGTSLDTENILQDNNKTEVRGRCRQCKIWIPFLLPLVSKKLVYLDQSFFSNIFSEDINDKLYEYFRKKLLKLKQDQKIFLIVSDIHSYETSNIPEKYAEKRTKLWQFQNAVADGCIATSFYDVFLAQTRRMLVEDNPLDYFPYTDIGLKNPHQWRVGINIIPTNSWRLKLHRTHIAPSDEQNEKIRRIIDRQVENIPDCRGVSDCLRHILEIWRKDLQQGIFDYIEFQNFMNQSEQYIKALEEGVISSINFPKFSDHSFYSIIKNVVNGLDENVALNKWSELLKIDDLGFCPSLRIKIAMEADLLWTRLQGYRTNPKKFNQNCGVSRQNDIDHISAFIPYVDTLTTDNDMRNLCKNENVVKEMEKYSTKIFSTDNFNEFHSWLIKLQES